MDFRKGKSDFKDDSEFQKTKDPFKTASKATLQTLPIRMGKLKYLYFCKPVKYYLNNHCRRYFGIIHYLQHTY